MNTFVNKNMIYWEQNNKAAQYIVYLYIGAKKKEYGAIAYQKIDEIYIAKSKTYHTFMDLVDISKKIDSSSGIASTYYKTTYLNYYVEVAAEDKFGDIIDKSELMLMTIPMR